MVSVIANADGKIQGSNAPDWRVKPSPIEYWPKDCAYTMFVDESGHADLGTCKRALASGGAVDIGDRFFAVTGMVISRNDWPDIRERVIGLKADYWPGGVFKYSQGQPSVRRVVFHSNEIRRRSGPFSEHAIPYDDFTDDLMSVFGDLPCTLFCTFIDKLALVRQYRTPYHPYHLSMTYMFERFALYYLQPQRCLGNVLLEARGKKEDRHLLKYLVSLLATGTEYVDAEDFGGINSIHFNTKWSEQAGAQQSYFGLELADIASYSLYKYGRNATRDDCFERLCPKLHGYPSYGGKGLKRFP